MQWFTSMIYIGGKLPHRFECSKRLQPCVKRLQGNSKRSHTNFRYRNKTHTSCIKNGDMSSTKTRACLKMLGSPHHILDVLLNLILFYIAQWSENGINWGSEIWWWFTKNIGVFDQRSSTQMSICHGQNVGWMWCRVMHPTMGIQTWTTIPQSSASYLSNLTMAAYGSHWL